MQLIDDQGIRESQKPERQPPPQRKLTLAVPTYPGSCPSNNDGDRWGFWCAAEATPGDGGLPPFFRASWLQPSPVPFAVV